MTDTISSIKIKKDIMNTFPSNWFNENKQSSTKFNN